MILLLAHLAFAQPAPDPVVEPATTAFVPTGPATSEQAMAQLDAGKTLTARRLALEVLARDPDDFFARWVVGKVTYEEEGNLPLAWYHLQRADRRFTRDRDALPAEAWRTHFHVLREMAWVAQDMEDHDLYFEIVDRHNQLYTPILEAERGWTLMAAGRLDEAREVATKALTSQDAWQRSLGLNVLCALEAKLRDREAALKACLAALDASVASGDGVVVDAFNAGLAAESALDFTRAEALYRQSAAGGAGLGTNPWQRLAEFELTRGRGPEAVQGLKNTQVWRMAQDPPTRGQTRAGIEATVALVLLVAGDTDKGMEVIDRALAQPDRRAHTTASAATTLGGHTVIRRAMRRAAVERAAEEASLQAFPSRWAAWGASWLPDPADAADRTALTGVLQDSGVLERTLNPYVDDGLSIPSWLVGDLIPVVGTGVAQVMVDRLRALDPYPGLGAYHDALEAEIAWHRGQSRIAELVASALEGLPAHEVLLRARVAALGADAAWRDGSPRAWGLYEQALKADPSVFRRLGLALPATISGGGSASDDDVLTMLARSPRLARDSAGFRVTATGGQICLASPSGTRLGCYRADPDSPAETLAEDTVRAFHRDAFGLPMGSGGRLDLKSLDGTTRLDDAARRQAIRGALDGL